MNIAAHTSDAGSGAVIGIDTTSVGDGNDVIVSAGADRSLVVVDPRAGEFNMLHRFTEHRDFIYSLHVSGQVAFSGGGDGMMLAHNAREGGLLFGLGANRAAVQSIGTDAAGTHLVAAGDDGTAIVYAF